MLITNSTSYIGPLNKTWRFCLSHTLLQFSMFRVIYDNWWSDNWQHFCLETYMCYGVFRFSAKKYPKNYFLSLPKKYPNNIMYQLHITGHPRLTINGFLSPGVVLNTEYTQCHLVRYHIFITVTWQRGLEALAYMPQYQLTQYLSWGANNNKQCRVRYSGGNSWH